MVKTIDIITWVATRNGEVAGVFLNRKEAVKWIKKLLSQTLKDLSKQDKTDEFDYAIKIPEYKIEETKQREPFLGL